MKHLHLPSGLLRGIPIIIPPDWSPEQALAVFELLNDLQHQIWSHYHFQLLALLREQQMPTKPPRSHNPPLDEPPF